MTKTEKGLTDWQMAALGKNKRPLGKRQLKRLLAKHPERVTIEPKTSTSKAFHLSWRGDEK